MRQYNSIKSKHPSAILLFRVGDFYETFGKDAIIVSKILSIVLTSRNNGSSKIELAGFPHHSLNTYLPKLVRAGQRVAICDQLEDPKSTKGIVKRGVTELVTAGVSYNELTFETKRNNFLASIYYNKDVLGISFLDISTGEFILAEGDVKYVDKLLQSLRPSEIIYQKESNKRFKIDFNYQCSTFMLDEWVFNADYADELLIRQFSTTSLKGFGVDKLENGIIAAGAALHYLKETKHDHTSHILSIHRIETELFVWMDRFTIRNLELFSSPNLEGKSLIQVLDNTKTAMGARMLRRWIALPLKEEKEIKWRHNIVEDFITHNDITDDIIVKLEKVGDLERLASKLATLRVNPKECVQLKNALISVLEIKNLGILSGVSNDLMMLLENIDGCKEIISMIEKELVDDPPSFLSKGFVINSGICNTLDELREIQSSARDFLDKMLEREIKRTGISSLKISFNNVFGYYLEVRNRFKESVPEDWIRKQTLVNAERYITEELKEYEQKILNAEERIIIIETEIFNNLIASISKHIQRIQLNASIIAKIDCLSSFSILAKNYNYNKPDITSSSELVIKQGRHPVIERYLKDDDSYIPNDIILNRESQQIMMITGPNMSGKSALLRQTALIVLMAQIGSYVPAKSANIGVVDKIFTRVGGSDNISMGESTFMVEMLETASILNNLSKNSLILLDEIGRGTSTYDGISIAWAIAEYLHEHPTKAKTLFATHYHELNEMSKEFNRIKNYNVSVKENKNNIIFIRTLKQGGSEHSFGIHVAKMAGIPNQVVKKANNTLKQLESSRSQASGSTKEKQEFQLSFFDIDDPVLEQIRDDLLEIDINSLTPVEALMKLNDIKKIIGK